MCSVSVSSNFETGITKANASYYNVKPYMFAFNKARKRFPNAHQNIKAEEVSLTFNKLNA